VKASTAYPVSGYKELSYSFDICGSVAVGITNTTVIKLSLTKGFTPIEITLSKSFESKNAAACPIKTSL
jgi:hypothetical protein